MVNSQFESCSLITSDCSDSNWHSSELINCRASGLQLQSSIQKNVHFKNCKLDLANMRFAKLTNVTFESCVVTGMDFYNAALKDVTFLDCVIEDIEFSGAKLHNVDISPSHIVSLKGIHYLKGAVINNEQLIYLAPLFAQEIGITVSHT